MIGNLLIELRVAPSEIEHMRFSKMCFYNEWAEASIKAKTDA